MKLVLGAVAAVMVLTATAFAQTDTTAPAAAVAANSSCAAITPEPAIPDGATADAAAVQAFDGSYQAWANATHDTLICRRAEVQALEARARALLEEHNAGAARLNALTQTWTAERAEFCSRRGVRCADAPAGN